LDGELCDFLFSFLVSKRYETKIRMVWGSFILAAAALKTLTRNGYNALGINLTCLFCYWRVALHYASALQLMSSIISGNPSIYTYLYMFLYVCIRIYVCIYMYMYMYVYVYKFTFTYTYTCQQACRVALRLRKNRELCDFLFVF